MTTIEAPIVAVSVYTDRARVTRRGSVHLTPGEHTLALSGLPSTLEEDSVRASGRGGGVKILGVEVVTQFVTQPPGVNVAELQRQLEALQDTDKALADADAAEAARLEFLKVLREAGGANLAKGIAFGRTTVDAIESLSQYLARELEAANTRRRDIAQKRRELAREIEAVKARLAQVQRGAANQQRAIHVAVGASAETDLELEVVYAVRGASWQPLYDVRLLDGRVALTYLARVRQQSGEDWPAVELSLSTARPAVSSTIPELRPWYVDVYQPPVPMKARAMAPLETLAEGPMLAAPAPAAPAAEMVAAEIERSGAAVTYRVRRPVAVPADGTPQKTTVTTLDFDARLDYVTVPKLAEEAYLRAKITNASDFALLPGPASIFHGPDFVGTTALNMIAPGEEFEVQLGVDDRIKVERELTERATAKAILSNTKRTQFGYKIVLTNHLAAPASVTVLDQLPVPRHEDIKIKLQDASPKPADQSQLNILKWELELQPQEKREVSFAFSVEHPREMMVAGISE